MGVPEAGSGPQMDDHTMQLERIRTQIEREEYAVDPDAVAAAIIARLLARQSACS